MNPDNIEAPMSHPILERHLERRALKPLYLFYGDEEFLMQRAVRRLAAALEERHGEAPLKVRRDASEIELEDFLALSREGSLWGSGQLLVLRRVDAYPAEDLKAINRYLDRPAPRAWVVLMAEGLKHRDLEKHPVWGRLQQADAALGFGRLREGDLYQWLSREAQALGKTMNQAAARRLVDTVGDNLLELSQELTKLALYAGEEKNLTPALVGQVATHSRTYNIFALVEALGEAGVHKRLAPLSHLLDLGEHPVQILGMLARQLRLLLRVKENPPGAPPEALPRSLRLPQWSVKKLTGQAARFSIPTLRAHLHRLHQADRQLKTSSANPQLWLEWTVLRMGPG